jgi:hypothetical protein
MLRSPADPDGTGAGSPHALNKSAGAKSSGLAFRAIVKNVSNLLTIVLPVAKATTLLRQLRRETKPVQFFRRYSLMNRRITFSSIREMLLS